MSSRSHSSDVDDTTKSNASFGDRSFDTPVDPANLPSHPLYVYSHNTLFIRAKRAWQRHGEVYIEQWNVPFVNRVKDIAL